MSFTRPCTLFVWAGAKTGHGMATSAPKLLWGKARINRGMNILHQPERILQEPLSILESISNSNVAECSKYVLCSKLIFWTCRGNSLVTQVFHLTLETTVLGYWINILVFSGRAEKKTFFNGVSLRWIGWIRRLRWIGRIGWIGWIRWIGWIG